MANWVDAVVSSLARQWRRVALAAGATGALACIGLAGFGWYYAGRLEADAFAVVHPQPKYDLRVGMVGDGRVELLAGENTDRTGAWQHEGVYGIQWPDGYAQISTIREHGRERVVRDVRVLTGALVAGLNVRIDTFAFPGDPREAFAYDFREVDIAGPLGPLPAWRIDGASGGTWAILVHGHRANRRDMLRQLPPLRDTGLTSLVITYRGDEGVLADPSGQLQFGATEWADLEAAVRYALAEHAQRIVLVGHSMGGAIVVSFLEHSTLAPAVSAVILDSPLLDTRATLDYQAADHGVPGFAAAVGDLVAAIRLDIDWGELDQFRHVDRLRAPILLFHGDADPKVPIATSRRLASARPDLVSFIETPGVAHVQSWNDNPAGYAAEVSAFLDRVLH